MNARRLAVAVVGATGAVGRAMLDVLAERRFPVQRAFALASERSAGQSVAFGEQKLTVQALAGFDFGDADLALFSAGSAVSSEFAPAAAEAGCVVVDNSSHFRLDPSVPLVVPEVNPGALADVPRAGRIVANPNCSTIQMVVALAPLHAAAGVARIDVATYQSVSGSGQRGIDALERQSRQLLSGLPLEPDDQRPIAFNALPLIDEIVADGHTREEMKLVHETRKILDDDGIAVNPHCVRVPVFFGHSEAVHVETKEHLGLEAAARLLDGAPGVEFVDWRTGGVFPTAASHAAGADAVYVGRLRESLSANNGLSMWIVADNVRKGAALNSVQIAESLLRDSTW